MTGKGNGGLSENWIGLERPSGKGRNESRRFEWVIVVGGGGRSRVWRGGGGDRESGQVRGNKTKRGVLSTDVEKMVRLGLALLHYAAAGGALCYVPATGRGGAATLRRRAVGAAHFWLLPFFHRV